MNILVILLRLIHIAAGVFWVGGSVVMVSFVQPTAAAIGPEGAKFMQRFAGPSRFPFFMNLAAPLTTLAGLILYWMDSGFRTEWIVTGPGLGFTLGGLVGIAAFVLGVAVMRPTTEQMAALGKEMQTAGGPPTPIQLSQMQMLQNRLHQGGLLGAILLVVAVTAMSVARYL
jgi:uncharacterized membrane protein